MFDAVSINGTMNTFGPVGPVCEATGFNGLTAAKIGGNVTGALDATGCDIGVYFGPGTTGSVTAADISGARHYGVVVAGVSANVTRSQIHQIGNSPFNGAQNGRAVFYANGATGTVSENTIYDYQKCGVHAFGLNTSVKVLNNTITGRGAIDSIAQNGVVIHAGANAQIIGNKISGHSYTPTSDIASGLLLYEAGGVSGSKPGIGNIKKDNTITGNETDIFDFGKTGKFTG